MISYGIHPGDILVVDRSLEARDGQIVIAIADGELTVNRMIRDGDTTLLETEASGACRSYAKSTLKLHQAAALSARSLRL